MTAFVRETWLTWLLLGMCLAFLGYDIWAAVHWSWWYWLAVVWFTVLALFNVALLRRQHAWVAGRAQRLALYADVRESFLESLRSGGVPADVLAEADRLFAADKSIRALRLLHKHLSRTNCH